jgi:hypothetical protein
VPGTTGADGAAHRVSAHSPRRTVITDETKADLLARNRRDCEAKVAELERRIDGRLRELRALLDWPPEAEFVAEAKLDQKLNDLITERMVYERLPDADARAVAEGRIEPFVGASGELRWRRPMKARKATPAV